MTDDQPSSELLRQLIERLDLLERCLATNTARLHTIEKHLELRQNEEPIPASSGDIQSSAAPVITEEVDTHRPAVVEQTVREFPDHRWSQPEPQLPRATEIAGTHAMPEAPETHSWTKETSALPAHQTRQASAPFPLHLPAENLARADQATRTTERDASRAAVITEEKRRDIESMIGGSWFNWIGIVAVTLGVGFFLKLAFDKQWVGPGTRVALSALAGISLLYMGDRLRKSGLKSYAFILSGGGVLILYLSDYAAYNFYNLIRQPLAFLLMAVVTTIAVFLSVRMSALSIAILGLIGGFLTPVMLSTGVDNEIALFTYIALLDAGVLALAYFKNWRSLDFFSFAGTVAITVGWMLRFFAPEKIWVTLVFLSIFFLIYALLAFFHNVLPGRLTRWFDVSLATANVTFYFVLSYVLLSKAGFDQATPATQALLLSIFFTWFFYATLRWSPDDRLLRYSYVGAATTFLSIAIAIQLELHWVTIAWAVEALMLIWVGLRSEETAARHAGLVVFGVAVAHWFVWDMMTFPRTLDSSFLPLINRRAFSSAILIAALAGAAWLYKRAGAVAEQERVTARSFFALTGNAVALTLLSLDLNDYFVSRLPQDGRAWWVVLDSLENMRLFSLSALWTLYATTLLAWGLLRRLVLLRCAGLLLLVVTIGKVVALDSLYYSATWHLPIFNPTFGAYALVVAALAFGSWLYGRNDAAIAPERVLIRPAFIVTANILSLAAINLEILGYYERLQKASPSGSEVLGPFLERKLFAVAFVWILYGISAFLFGAWRQSRAWRFGGLALLVLSTPFVFANLIYYDAAWHTLIFNRMLGAFAMFVAATWLVVRTYAGPGEMFEEASLVRPVATVIGNVFAITALSAQAAGYYDARIADGFGRALSSAAFEVPSRNLELAKQLSLSVVWALYACGLLVAGRVRRLRLLRLMGIGLLSITTLKAFFWDLSSLDRAYRIVSFVMLGAILLVVSYFYQRSQQATEEKPAA